MKAAVVVLNRANGQKTEEVVAVSKSNNKGKNWGGYLDMMRCSMKLKSGGRSESVLFCVFAEKNEHKPTQSSTKDYTQAAWMQ